MPTRKNEYGTPNLEIANEIPQITQNRLVEDVEAEFNRIVDQADHLAVHDGELFVDKRKFRYTHINRAGINEARNHFQGVQRLRKGRYLIISGGDVTEPVSHLFVVHMASRRAKGALGTNLLYSLIPKEKDRIIKTIPLNRNLWHAGGLSVSGDILAVPLENDMGSKIIFLDMSEPENPRLLPCEINRPSKVKSGAVAFARLSDDKFICAIWHEVKKKPKGRLDFYISKSLDLKDGFEEKMITWNYGDLALSEARDPAYQNINFVEPIDKGINQGGTRLYLIGTENTAAAAPIQGGKDLADLFEVQISNNMLDTPMRIPQLKRINTKQFFCNREYCNLDAAGGIYIDPVEGLHVYATFHWRINDTIRLAEFRHIPDDSTPGIDSIQKAWIDLYEDPKFGSRRLSILGTQESQISDYGKIFAQGAGFDKKASSARFQIPSGYTYRLYKNKNFEGQKPGEDYIDLIGTGYVEKIEDLSSENKKFDNMVSSSKYLESI